MKEAEEMYLYCDYYEVVAEHRSQQGQRGWWGIRTLPSVSAKDAESGGKERQIRRPFHSDVQFLRSLVQGSFLGPKGLVFWVPPCQDYRAGDAIAFRGRELLTHPV
jgi:hypothetical protein